MKFRIAALAALVCMTGCASVNLAAICASANAGLATATATKRAGHMTPSMQQQVDAWVEVFWPKAPAEPRCNAKVYPVLPAEQLKQLDAQATQFKNIGSK
jgi:hypothetical protein